jgi:hypothetical protein
MYSIILKGGEIVKVRATSYDWEAYENIVRFYEDGEEVANISMDNVVGWINYDNMREDKECR